MARKWWLVVVAAGSLVAALLLLSGQPPPPTAAQATTTTVPVVQFTTTQFGSPNPVQPGAQVTWFLQGVNGGSDTLEDISWSNPTCGSETFPGPFTMGQTTPSATCTTTAPLSGQATLSVQWTAEVVTTGQILTPLVTTTDPVASPTTTTSTTAVTTTTVPATTTSGTAAPSTTTTTTATTTTLTASAATVVATAISVSSSANPSAVGQPVSYTATLAPPPVDGGAVEFRDGGAGIPGCTSSSVSTLTTTAICTVNGYSSPGPHTITASYLGTSGYAPSVSAPYTQVVQAAPMVTGIHPASGLPSGGTVVTVTGSGFVPGATSIQFGRDPATNVDCPTSTTCAATSPPAPWAAVRWS